MKVVGGLVWWMKMLRSLSAVYEKDVFNFSSVWYIENFPTDSLFCHSYFFVRFGWQIIVNQHSGGTIVSWLLTFRRIIFFLPRLLRVSGIPSAELYNCLMRLITNRSWQCGQLTWQALLTDSIIFGYHRFIMKMVHKIPPLACLMSHIAVKNADLSENQ